MHLFKFKLQAQNCPSLKIVRVLKFPRLFFSPQFAFLKFCIVSDRTRNLLLEDSYSSDILEQQWIEHQKSHKKSFSYETFFFLGQIYRL